MEDLIKKFKSNTLSPCELEKLRAAVGSMSDKELERLFLLYGNDDDASNDVSDEEIAGILSSIRGRVASDMLRKRNRYRISAVAAAIALPLLAVVAWLLISLDKYTRYDQLLASTTEIRTGIDESVTVRLPDGTDALVASDSYIKYSIKDFNDEERILEGNGELRLSVARKEKCPFILKAFGLEVKVLGTKFVLLARDSAPAAMLFLEEGSVEMTSTTSGDVIRIKPNELAIMDYKTGKFRIESMDNSNDAVAVMRGDISFSGAPLTEVLDRLGETYGIKFRYADSDVDGKTFTGYIPTTDLEEATGILTEVFNLRAEMSGEDVIISVE